MNATALLEKCLQTLCIVLRPIENSIGYQIALGKMDPSSRRLFETAAAPAGPEYRPRPSHHGTFMRSSEGGKVVVPAPQHKAPVTEAVPVQQHKISSFFGSCFDYVIY